MKEKIAENISNIDIQAKPDAKERLNQLVSALAITLVVSLGVIGASPRIALAEQPAGKIPAFLCTDPNNLGQEIYVFGGTQVATYRQLGADCKPTFDTP